jgi:hypothetical protein
MADFSPKRASSPNSGGTIFFKKSKLGKIGKTGKRLERGGKSQKCQGLQVKITSLIITGF